MRPQTLVEVQFVSPLDQVDRDNDNVDVHIRLGDGRVYSLLIATPSNIYRCMDNEGIDHFFSHPPPLLVKVLDEVHVHRAISALLSSESENILGMYGVLQSSDT